MAQPRILVVEDETDILDLVEFNLVQAGFKVSTATDGLAGLNRARQEHPDLIVLDLMLPEMDGKEVCRRIRAGEDTADIPVLMLTAKAEEVDRIIGFEIGADDYMTKPFSPRELVLRVQAVLRRSSGGAKEEGSVIRVQGLVIDPQRHKVELDGRELDLTPTEFGLLEHLAASPGRVQTRDALLDGVWGFSFDGYGRTVDTHIRRLRQKFGPAKDLIETVRGLGYRFREE